MKLNYTKFIFGALALSLAGYATNPNNSGLTGSIKETKANTIVFIENKGQVSDQFNNPRPDVLYSGMTNGMVYHLKNNGISYQLSRVDSWISVGELSGMKLEDPRSKALVPEQTTVYRLDIKWKGINSDYKIEKENSQASVNNYYLTNTNNSCTNVKSYEGVIYRGIYKNIDLHYYNKENTLKYDYIVAPGADYKQIQLEVSGADKISIQPEGSVVIETPLGKIEEGTPVAYQGGKKVETKWVLNDNVLSFEIENYDPSKELIIDPPTRVWGTYYGGTGNEYGQSTSIDAAGNVYLAGYTNSSVGTIMATTGSHQATFGGGTTDAFLVKFNSAGVRQWGTYYGGTGADYGYSCRVDASGNVFLAGYTTTGTSALIAPAGGHQTTYGGNNDAFLVKFNGAGVRQWGTYYGGTGGDIAYACAVDASGNVYISGYSSTTTGNVIATVGSHQTTMGGTFDAFIAKFNATGVRQWGTYYGGTGGEYSYGCAVDGTGNVYMTGFTNSGVGTVIATVGSHQAAYGGGDDAFLVKFNSAGVRQWGTYYGAAVDNDYAYGCATDASGNVYISGLTSSSSAISTPGSHQPVYGGGYDAFLVKFNTSGVRQWGTYYGDSGYDEAQSCSADASGNVYMAGSSSTFIGNSIASVGTYQVANGGGNDAFLVKFTATGARDWGTYYGGLGNDLGFSCSAEASDYVYLSGRSSTTTGGIISSTGSHQASNGGNDDAFLVKFCNQPNLPTNLTPVSNQTLCANNSTTLSATGMGSISWFSTPTGGAPIATGTTYITPTLTAGTYTYYVEAATCTVSPTRTPITVTVSAYPVISVNSGSICAGGSFTMVPTGAASYTFQGGSAVVSPGSSTTYTVRGSSSFGCLSTGIATSSVTVIANPTISVNSGAICIGKSFTMTPSGATSYTYQGGSAVVSPTANSTYTVIGSNGAGCISNIVTSSVTVNSLPVIAVNSGTICSGNTFTIIPSGALSYTYQGGSATVSPVSNTSYTVIGSNALGCVSNPVTSNVTVYALPVVSAIASFSAICQGQNVNITANGANTYSWNTGATSQVIGVSPTVTTIYSVIGTDLNGCSKTATTSITVNTNPTISVVASPTAICIGKTATLTASGATSYLWNTASSSPSIIVSPSSSTGFTVTGSNAAGCSATRTIALFVNPLPTINITPASTNICIGKTATLTANGASTYTWNTTATTAVIAVTPSTTTNYVVTGTDANGCVNSNNASVIVNPLPNVLSAAGPTVVCIGSSSNLSSAGAVTYSWSSGATTSTTNVTPTVTTTYTVFGTNANGCTNTSTVMVAVNPLPSVLATPASSAICIGKTTTVTASGASTYVWNTTATTPSIVVTPLTNTSYTVTGTDVFGCVNSATTMITVNPLPTVSIASTNSVLCAGQTLTLTAGGASTYTWNTGSNSAMIADSPTVTTTYSVFALDVNGCSGSAISSVTINALPVMNAITSASTVCAADTVTLTASGALTYTWSSGGFNATEVVTPTITTTYTVSGTNSNGCTNSAFTTVTVNPLPSLVISSSNSVICVGQTATLSVSGANTYSWSSGGTTSLEVVTPTITTTYTVTGVDLNNCVNSDTLTQFVSLCTSVASLNNNSDYISVYPNPSEGIYNLELPAIATVTINDVFGKQLFKQIYNDGKHKIDLSGFANGVYFLNCEIEGRLKIMKLIKN